MLSTLLAVTVAAASPSFSLAIPGLNAVKLAPGEGDLYANVLSQKLLARGVKVFTPRDMAAVLGLERQKQLMTPGECNEACTAEMAAALGVDALLVGDIGQLGTHYTIGLKLLSAKDGSVLAFHNATDIPAEGMVEALDRASHELLLQVSATRPEVTAGVSSGRGKPKLAIAPAAVGVIAVVGGGICLGLAQGQLGALRSATSMPTAAAARDSGATLQTVGWVGVGVGTAALVGAGLWFFLGGDSPVTPTASLTSSGASLGLAGTF